MAFKREHVEQFVAQHAPGERLVTYLVTSKRGASFSQNVGVGSASVVVTRSIDLGDERRIDLYEALGLDPDRRVGEGQQDTFYALTDRQILFGNRTSLRNHPKDLLHTAPADGVRVHWYDDAQAGSGNSFRHMIIEFGDGAWRGDRAGLTALGRKLKSINVDEFFEVLGDRAIHIPQPSG